MKNTNVNFIKFYVMEHNPTKLNESLYENSSRLLEKCHFI